MKRTRLPFLLLLAVATAQLRALDYPGTAPGTAERSVTGDRLSLANAAIRAEWQLDKGRIASLMLENRHSGQSLRIGQGHLPRVLLKGGRAVDLASLTPSAAPRIDRQALAAEFKDDPSGLAIHWSATLEDGANAVIQSLQLTASRDTGIDELVFLDTPVDGASQAGEVAGSVVVCGDLFLAVEHPLANNTVDSQTRVRCALPRGNVLRAGHSWSQTSVFGAVPPGQLRRGFLHYLEARRAHPYRPFLHYNNWYNVNLSRPVERTNETECLETIALFGSEFIGRRGVKLDTFVWDDGWDDHNSLWGFHQGFPDGFRNLKAAAAQYGAAQGVWMSPWGGYAPPKERRLAFGRAHGYETNASGFSMAGPNYGKAFREVCLRMMREQGVTFFKFDGMGGGNEAAGAGGELAEDIDAVLDLTLALRRENPEVFISATVGTWASPFWTRYADSIWRQGGDNGLYGKGNTRQQWITYRDKFCYERIVRLGPLYPLNSLMLGGILIGDRRAPARIVRDEKSLADEIWSFFGSGTCLQELYVNPAILTDQTWDALAAAAKWSRSNRDVLVDTHWVGGDPGRAEVYGWASWRPGRGILVLRNPSDQPQAFRGTLQAALEMPAGAAQNATPKVVYPEGRNSFALPPEAGEPVSLHLDLDPFEVLVIEL